ncbi:MAG: multiheme c-type cytochrome [Rubripirellula sp.]|nr:multiheme c-type cytochrome [Rubripirellula sp.]
MPRPNQIFGLLMIWFIQSSLLAQNPQDSLLLSPADISLAGQLDDNLLDGGDEGDPQLTDPQLTDPLSSFGDPLDGIGPAPRDDSSEADGDSAATPDPHEALWTEDCYPSAESCRACHPGQYDEWRASGHAYAAVSPMFSRFEQAMTDLTRGTVGAFCVRCHSPVGTQLKIPRAASMLDAPPVVREGVTCIACHRIREHYGRSNGDRRIEPGDIYQPVGASGNGAGLRDAIRRADELKLRVHAEPNHASTFHGDSAHGSPAQGSPAQGSPAQGSPAQGSPGQAIHKSSYFFEPLKNSDVCVSCHQVAVHPGIWLEVVHAQYRSGPAAKKGITCQQCHMGSVPGKPDGYEWGHVAEINGKPFGSPRKRSNHLFWGPGYSIAHPGIFPHNPDAKRYTPRDWLAFDYRAGWGTEQFEASVPPDQHFPAPWDHSDDRRDGRRVIEANLAKLQEKRGSAVMTLEAGVKVSGPMFLDTPRRGKSLKIAYRVDNKSEGHNLPTGSLGAQPQLWLNAVLIDPDGCRVWESGYLDRQGDLADMHSVEVAKGRIPRDRDLFNLQTKFLINNIRGTDREAAVPLNFSLDQLVFLRPGAVPVSVLNHPPLIRMEAHSIPPLDHRTAKYRIPASAMRKPGLYRLSVRMRSRMEPPYFMRLVESTPEMIRRMNENMIDTCISSHTFQVN